MRHQATDALETGATGEQLRHTCRQGFLRDRSACTATATDTQCGGETDTAERPPVSARRVRWRDLPNKDQLFILALCRFSEPLSNVCLLPYIFYLVRSTLPTDNDETPDATAARVSEYSGLLVAAFPLAQFAVSLPWGRLSDARGRRLSILIGLLASTVANVGFGLSRSFGALLFCRIVAGLANGNVGIMRTVTAEIVRERKYQTKAFLLLPLVFNSGMVASLALGGFLAEPATNLPWLFGPSGVFNTNKHSDGVEWTLTYPYALPAFMNAMFLTVALVAAFFGLRETLPGKEGYSDYGLRIGRMIGRFLGGTSPYRAEEDYTIVDGSEERLLPDGAQTIVRLSHGEKGSMKPEPSLGDILDRKVISAMLSFGLLPLHNSTFMHIFPVYLSSPPSDNSEATLFAFSGGLGLRSATIGIWLSVFGVCGIFLQLFIYPRMQARWGTLGVFRIALVLFPITYAAAPYLSLVAGDHDARWIFLGLVVCAQIMARTMAIPSTVILLTESAPQKTCLGTIHGAGNMLASLARAVGPALGGWVFAMGVHEGVVGMVWWFYLVTTALVALAWSFLMDVDGFTK
ncbi:uncharacterized protein JN550_012398 [Neoarthrinium moseri]|uniref:uncharacterized protein n=1 Tax=Neoarthrinium moseri TaxID=1658444 RepID=UPI001FDDD104|nr:uncharacterized protein JN550_012398 [Neoarthrinium moseri]KAI1858836.1 hypothetical protein JN550_012398 [Neoarthrinium moseri]